jgi:hypothetical protein
MIKKAEDRSAWAIFLKQARHFLNYKGRIPMKRKKNFILMGLLNDHNDRSYFTHGRYVDCLLLSRKT